MFPLRFQHLKRRSLPANQICHDWRSNLTVARRYDRATELEGSSQQSTGQKQRHAYYKQITLASQLFAFHATSIIAVNQEGQQ